MAPIKRRKPRAKSCPILPEHFAEEILARLPYPQIFKVRMLSKEWLARLSPVSSHEGDKEKKRLAVSFQQLIDQHSSKWKTFSPTHARSKDFISYDWTSKRWRNILPHSFLAEIKRNSLGEVDVLDMAGVLLLISTGVNDLYVANVLSQNWKQLPAAPGAQQRWQGIKLVSDASCYKIIAMFSGETIHCSASIYNSQSGLWTTQTITVASNLILHKEWGASLNGVVYWLVSSSKIVWDLLSFNVKEETFVLTWMPPLYVPSMETHNERRVQLMVCTGRLMLLVFVQPRSTMIVKQIDLQSHRWLNESWHYLGGGTIVDFHFKGTIGRDGDSIFFVNLELLEDPQETYVLAYDVLTKKWDFIFHPKLNKCPPNSEKLLTFQPGLNPFVAP